MGYFVDMCANFANEEAARRFESFYQRTEFRIPSGVASLRVGASKLPDSHDWQCGIIPYKGDRPLYGSGRPESDKDIADVDEAVRVMYRRLVMAPPFRFAIAGVETTDWIDFAELKKRVQESPDEFIGPYGYRGLTVPKDSFIELGCPLGFIPAGGDLLQIPFRSSREW